MQNSDDNFPSDGTLPRAIAFVGQSLSMIGPDELIARLDDPSYVWQERITGERRQIIRIGDQAIYVNSQGEVIPVGDAIIAALRNLPALPAERTILDGVVKPDGRFAPFDLISHDTASDLQGPWPYVRRLGRLESFLAAFPSPCWFSVVTAYTPNDARKLLKAIGACSGSGIVGKSRNARFRAGEVQDQFVFSFFDRAACLVTDVDENTRSASLAVLSMSGSLMPLNRVAIPSGAPMPSAGSVVSVEYLFASRYEGLVQARYRGILPEGKPDDCVASQLKYQVDDRFLKSDLDDLSSEKYTP